MRFQLGIQIILLITAAVIAFSVIKPKFADIRSDQNEVVAYRTALENIGRYNQRLQALINQSDALSGADRAALFRYLPESVDATAVSRDIANIVSRNRLLLLDVSFEPLAPVTAVTADGTVVMEADPLASQGTGGQAEGGDVSVGLQAQRFKVDAVGTYAQMKTMLQDFERNNYPLRLIDLNFTLEETASDLVQYSLLLETYALPASSASPSNI